MNIIGRHLKITNGMEKAIYNRFDFLKTFTEKNEKINFTIEKLNNVNIKTSIMLNYKNNLIKISETSNDFYLGLDMLELKLKRKMRKVREFKRDIVKHRQEQFNKKNENKIESKENPEINNYIVKRKYFDIKPMSETEAILQIKLLKHKSFLFKNSDSDCKTCLLYEREDNNYGIIEENF